MEVDLSQLVQDRGGDREVLNESAVIVECAVAQDMIKNI
ncbi:hypothetical protein L916_14943 [Phytophthora nicotianae]|uniref:Uncharacterized protein n=1 Tax=Phytophthora nicotianae TaxID=4792 RepID=W2IE02_PHYNI|nr:hypothetical protein L916_14943 [Phytophthora nicotianae]